MGAHQRCSPGGQCACLPNDSYLPTYRNLNDTVRLLAAVLSPRQQAGYVGYLRRTSRKRNSVGKGELFVLPPVPASPYSVRLNSSLSKPRKILRVFFVLGTRVIFLHFFSGFVLDVRFPRIRIPTEQVRNVAAEELFEPNGCFVHGKVLLFFSSLFQDFCGLFTRNSDRSC